MKRVLVLVGLPASGKSTFANNLLLAEPGCWVRSNKDALRAMAHASHWSKGNEKFILRLRDQIILMAMADGKNIIVDDTNFGKHIDQIKELVKGEAIVEVNDSFLKVPLEECIRRDALRPQPVGKGVIMQMYRKYVQVLTLPPVHDPNLADAIIVDMDGTLSLLNGRNPYDAFTCDQDLPNQPVLDTVLLWQRSIKVIILSGRMDDCKLQTEKWLAQYGVKPTAIFMRATGDQRKDSIIKQEIFDREVLNKYNVKFILDDRQQVVDMWRSLGLTVFQVAEGDF
jgi:predicted kinase